MNALKNRNEALDIIRIAAAGLVIVIHVCVDLVKNYPMDSAAFLAGNLADTLARAGVPLFLMVSGALMLEESKEITPRSLWQKNIKPIALLLLFWQAAYTLLYRVLFCLVQGQPLSWQAIVTELVSGHYHLWYLYVLLGLYAITPFLRCFVKQARLSLVKGFLVLGLAEQFSAPLLEMAAQYWSPVTYIIEFMDRLDLQFVCGYTVYYVAGWYLSQKDILSKRQAAVLYAAGALSAFLTFLYVQCTGDYILGYSNMSLLIFLYSAALFCALQKVPVPQTHKGKKRLTGLSSLTFGVYILHPMFLDVLQTRLSYARPILDSVLLFVLTALFSLAASFVLSKIPFLAWSIHIKPKGTGQKRYSR